ncbi:uncharacterized protein LY79DRAFT_695562 [Colletotrichum navitas]|uniref:Uncharacterized protein n=1 Tax=Colletotrichum navitas TaxID=681940 RepID=A0AAD8PR79_9PEZI|nr:uncharacterized protein LY79DRAFT_695562 [Colletotrichum navitas]KAK1574280.1 hypothetical protein LY79DRAFT_695562 [Colletotrichum navitas]
MTSSAGGVVFHMETVIAVVTATFTTQEERHSWTLIASFICLLLWISITTGLSFYYHAFLLRQRFWCAVSVILPTLVWAVLVYTKNSDVGHAFHFLPVCIEFGLIPLAISYHEEPTKPVTDDDNQSPAAYNFPDQQLSPGAEAGSFAPPRSGSTTLHNQRQYEAA